MRGFHADFDYLPHIVHSRAGIDRAIVDNIVDRALFPTIDKHASLSTKRNLFFMITSDECETLLPSTPK